MNIMEVIYNITSSILQLMIVHSFFSLFGIKKKNNKPKDIIIIVSFVTLTTLFTLFIKEQTFFTILVTLIIILYSFKFYMNIIKRIFSVVLICALLLMFEVVFGLLISLIYDSTIAQMQTDLSIYIQCILFSKLSLLAIIKFISNLYKPKNNNISIPILITLVFLPITTFVIIYTLTYYVYDEDNSAIRFFIMLSSFLVVISNIFVFYTFDYIQKQDEQKNNLKLQAMQVKLEYQYYVDLSEKQLLSNKTLHDLKNELFAIRSMLNVDSKMVKEEIDRICNIVTDAHSKEITGIESIDSLLASKIIVAKSRDIKIEIISFISKINPNSIIDLTIIFGNLMDNALEACEKVATNKFINLEIRQIKNNLIIKVENSSIDNDFNNKTTKENKYLHGFGLKNVKDICDRYEGIMEFGIKNNVFIINIALCNNIIN